MSQSASSRKCPLDQAFWALIVAICVVMGAGICVMGLGQAKRAEEEVNAAPTSVAQAKPGPSSKASVSEGPQFTEQGIQEEPEAPALTTTRPRPADDLPLRTVSARGEGLEGIERRLDEIVSNLSNLPDRFARNTTSRGAGDQSVEFVREFRQLLETARQRGATAVETPPVANRSHAVSRSVKGSPATVDRELPETDEPQASNSLTFDGGIESADEPEAAPSRVARGLPATETAPGPRVAEPGDDEPGDDEPTTAVVIDAPPPARQGELASPTPREESLPDLEQADPRPSPSLPATTTSMPNAETAPVGDEPELSELPGTDAAASDFPAAEVPAGDAPGAQPAVPEERPATSGSAEGTPNQAPAAPTDAAPVIPQDERTELLEEGATQSSTTTGPTLTLTRTTARLSSPPLPVEVAPEGLSSAAERVAGDALTGELAAGELATGESAAGESASGESAIEPAAPGARRAETAIEIFTPQHLSAAELARHLEPQLTAGVGDIRSTEDASGRAGVGNHTARPAVVVRDTPTNLARLRRLADEVDVPATRPAAANRASVEAAGVTPLPTTPAANPTARTGRAERQSLVLDVTAVAIRLSPNRPMGVDLTQLARRRAGFELHSLQESTRRGDVRLASAESSEEDPALSLGVLTGSQQRLLQELRISGPVSVVARSRVTLKDGQATRLSVEEPAGANQEATRSSCLGMRPRLQSDGSLLLQLLDCNQPVEAGREPLAELRVAGGETAVLAGMRSNRPTTVRDPRVEGGARVASQPVEWVYLVTPRLPESR